MSGANTYSQPDKELIKPLFCLIPIANLWRVKILMSVFVRICPYLSVYSTKKSVPHCRDTPDTYMKNKNYLFLLGI